MTDERQPPGDGDTPTPSWIRAALRDGGRDLERLAKRVGGIVRGHVAKCLRRWPRRSAGSIAELRDDLIQLVMLELFKDQGRVLRQWDPQRGASLSGYLAVITYRICRRDLSKKNNDPSQTRLPGTDWFEGRPQQSLDVLDHWYVEKVRKELFATFSSRDRELYWSLYVDEKPVQQVADEHSMSRDAVYQWVARLKKRIAGIVERVEAPRGGGEA